MLLSLRGWGEEEFRRARPDFLRGARWALFAERVMPMLEEERKIQGIDLPTGADPQVRGNVGRAKMEAAKNIESMTAVLFPADGNG